MASYTTMGSTRHSDETMDDDIDDKDDTKRRKSRNLSEKKRRDQFNMLVSELANMVTTNTRKMDKSTVLKATISFLKNHNEVAVRSRVHEIQEDWKPAFLSNEEFTHLILEALDGFIMIFSSNGRIYYASESVTSLLGYLPNELSNSTIYEITYQEDQSLLYNVLLNPGNQDEPGRDDNQVSFTCHIKRGNSNSTDETVYERVNFVGYFRTDSDIESLIPSTRYTSNITDDTKMVFVGTGRLHTPQLIRDVSLIDINKSEFVSKHSLEWKFLFLDQRASPIIGYLPFEVLGTSGYDYYHVDDLDKVVTCHESLMRKGEGTSCFYRFLTKGQQWIWLQTRFYIDYNQWNSKPEFIVCTHNVINYSEVIKQLKKTKNDNVCHNQESNVIATGQLPQQQVTPCQTPRSSAWSSKSPKTRSVTRSMYHGTKSDTCPSVGLPSSRVSASPTQGNKLKSPSVNTTKTVQVQGENRQRETEVETDCLNYEAPRYSGETIQATPGAFLPPAAPPAALAISPNPILVNQQNIVMTTAQNHIQDELQRKHEELQQLIVHQQEELRRVSEQLFIARYGILSPLVNVGVPYTVNTCPSMRCDNNTNDANRLTQCNPVQSGPVTIPVTVPVQADGFSHSGPVPAVPIAPSTIPQTQQIVNPGISFMQPQIQTHCVQRNEAIQHVQQGQIQNTGQIMPFQICQQPEILYNSVDTINGQNSGTRN